MEMDVIANSIFAMLKKEEEEEDKGMQEHIASLISQGIWTQFMDFRPNIPLMFLLEMFRDSCPRPIIYHLLLHLLLTGLIKPINTALLLCNKSSVTFRTQLFKTFELKAQ